MLRATSVLGVFRADQAGGSDHYTSGERAGSMSLLYGDGFRGDLRGPAGKHYPYPPAALCATNLIIYVLGTYR